jgi:hypothetical protein
MGRQSKTVLLKPQISYQELVIIVENANFSGKSKSKALTSIVNSLLLVKKINGKVNYGEISHLFTIAYEKTGDDYYKLLLRLFVGLVKTHKKSETIFELEIGNVLFKEISSRVIDRLIRYGLNDGEIDLIRNFETKEYLFKPQVIRPILEKATSISCNSCSKEEVASLLYIFTIYSNLRNRNIDEISLILEREIAEYVSQHNKKTLNKLISLEVPKILTAKNSSSQLKKMTYLYYDSNTIMTKLIAEKTDVYKKNIDLRENLIQADQAIIDFRNKSSQYERHLLQLEKVIEDLKTENKIMQDRLEFDKNRYEQQYINMKNALSYSLKKSLDLEILGIEDSIHNLPEKEKSMIHRRLTNIYKITNDIGGK